MNIKMTLTVDDSIFDSDLVENLYELHKNSQLRVEDVVREHWKWQKRQWERDHN